MASSGSMACPEPSPRKEHDEPADQQPYHPICRAARRGAEFVPHSLYGLSDERGAACDRKRVRDERRAAGLGRHVLPAGGGGLSRAHGQGRGYRRSQEGLYVGHPDLYAGLALVHRSPDGAGVCGLSRLAGDRERLYLWHQRGDPDLGLPGRGARAGAGDFHGGDLFRAVAGACAGRGLDRIRRLAQHLLAERRAGGHHPSAGLLSAQGRMGRSSRRAL